MSPHPYREAWRTRDVAAWRRALAPDATLHSPIFSTPFHGPDAIAELTGVLLHTLGEVQFTHDLASEAADGEDTHAFFWRAQLAQRTVEGVDLVRRNAHGQVVEIRVMIRPLVDIAAFSAAVGPSLAALRGRGRAPLLRIFTVPVRAILALADVLGVRLVQRR